MGRCFHQRLILGPKEVVLENISFSAIFCTNSLYLLPVTCSINTALKECFHEVCQLIRNNSVVFFGLH